MKYIHIFKQNEAIEPFIHKMEKGKISLMYE